MKKWIVFFIGVIYTSLVMGKSSNLVSITGIQESHEKNSVGICLQVSDYFSTSSDVSKAKPYIKLYPKQYFKLTFSYRRICIENLNPQTTYTIDINKNIPLGSKVLDKSYHLSQKTTNYLPSASFEESGYILPTYGNITIPITTKNVIALKVSLYRINQHNLMRAINDYGFIKSMYSYEFSKVASTDGYKLWEKTLPLHTKLNQGSMTAIPVGNFLEKKEAGVYILYVKMLDNKGEVIYDYKPKMQWFMISNIGLFTLKSDNGLTVFTKSLSSALVYNGVKLELIAKNNEILETLISKNGEATFKASLLKGKNGLTPKAIYAYGKKGDFTVLDLSRPAHDLSDRGVKGRDIASSSDVFLYSNRGIFKPSEKVTLHALVRDKLGFAKEKGVFSLKLFDARGVEAMTSMVKSDKLGHLTKTISLSASATTGKWHFELLEGDKKPIGSYSFLVEDFVPPKIRLKVLNKPTKVVRGEKNLLKVEASYLNGNMLPNASVEVNTILHHAKEPFKRYRGYTFGDIKEHFSNERLGKVTFETDKKGEVDIPFILVEKSYSTLPISAHIDISVNELGGRAVHKVMDLFYEDKSAYIGLKPLFDDNAIDRNAKAKFRLIYLKKGKCVRKKLSYRVIEENAHWHWRSSNNGDWEYYKTYSDSSVLVKGTQLTSSKGAVVLTLNRLDWGNYRIEFKDDEGIITTYRFTSGYDQGNSKASPDKLPLKLDKKSYRVGDILQVHITSKFSGVVEVLIGHHKIIQKKRIFIKRGEDKSVPFKVKKSWGNSAYVLATVFRGGSTKLGANRAIGVAHIEVIHSEQRLNLKLSHKKRTHSSSTLKVDIHCKEAKGVKTYVTLSLVDEGVLNLTNYQTPNPIKYFLGQQKLGLEIKDIYGNLIEEKGASAKFNVGAGDMLKVAITDGVVSNKSKVVSLFTKAVAFDENGDASVDLNIPDYQGSLRLVAIGWNKKATGVSKSDIVVKDPISIAYYMPKFIGVTDKANTLVTIDFDTRVKKGQYKIYFSTLGGVTIEGKKSFIYRHTKTALFKEHLIVKANSLKEGIVIVEVEKNGKIIAQKEWHIGIREEYPQSYLKKMGTFKPNTLLNLQTIINKKQWKNINSVTLSITPQPTLPINGIIAELLAYEGRCAEQTTSRAMPWLFKKERTALENGLIQRAIDRVLTYQKVNGGFGLWKSSHTQVWVSAFVLDFLSRAKELGFEVPLYAFNRGLDWLENSISRWHKQSWEREGDIYALYVLTRENRTLISELNFYAKSNLNSALSLGHLASAYHYIGAFRKSKSLFLKGLKKLEEYPHYFYSNYGGYLRDSTALLSLIKESNLKITWNYFMEEVIKEVKNKSYFSTQEMSSLIRLSYLLNSPKVKSFRLAIHGKIFKKLKYEEKKDLLADISSVRNKSLQTLWYSVTAKATPLVSRYQKIKDKGFSIEKEIYTLEGKKVNLHMVKPNSRLVVVLSGKVKNRNIKNPLISDWLGAGFEIENPHILGIDATSSLKWLGRQTETQNRAYRDDRFAVALNVDNNRSFKVAYIIRAVTKGEYTLPPALILDMYQPHYRAFSHFLDHKVSIEMRNSTLVTKGLTEKIYNSFFNKRIRNFKRFSIIELNILRNALLAYNGLDFERINPLLHQKFSAFSWYQPQMRRRNKVYKYLTSLQKRNFLALEREERKRGGGLLLNDFYLVAHKPLQIRDIRRYSKKELRILRNSLIARFGYDYKNQKSLDKIYHYMPWYNPSSIKASKILDEKMRPFLKANVLLMLKREKML